MAKKVSENKTTNKVSFFKKIGNFFRSRQTQTIIGLFLILFAFFLIIAFISFFFSWQEDQSALKLFTDKTIKTQNLLGKIGATLSHIFVYNGFGLATFILPFLLLRVGVKLLLQLKSKNNILFWNWGLFIMLWISVAFGFINKKYILLSGAVGFEINEYLQTFLGKTGLIIVLLFLFIAFLVIKFRLTPDKIINKINEYKSKKPVKNEEEINSSSPTNQDVNFTEPLKDLKPTIDKYSTIPIDKKNEEISFEVKQKNEEKSISIEDNEVGMNILKGEDEEIVTENISKKLVDDFGEFDPTLELSDFKFPSFNLLKQYNDSISVDKTELEANKDRIVETLKNYKIGIAEIKATVGPTITLYEIVPEAGIRISKIKNLEDDIALSLSALGIRIIAPIPGKGTIGIEVPNRKASIVSMHSVISSKRFQESKMELPVALGKTISNETFVVDLAKMPHLLMAGATGQGKSVGLNAILTSLLYRKHPAEVKFVLVDPKKVELTLFNKIERHYLAKIPDSEDAIITDNTKVINTLNSLCIEMDNRYDLLKTAMVRNIKEYNTKFKARKLNPENGHQFLPYIVLVIDEFADLIMTAGKEVETPIARLAQLARAIGIHLIVATQRPSVNVITGIIKANFPSRVAFRVTSKIDSRTILDAPGADQLIGRGDMLYSGGNDLVRIQCAFVDTPEVEKITDFIGSQRAYPDAYLLPEYVGEEGGTNIDIDIEDRDKLFREAAEIIVTAQQGSASLLQRKLKLGYNRAGRIIDQLEAAGIVGPFEGSKARQVLVPDFIALEQLLENEQNQ
ncbi:MAG: DNA translocase FtsK 4TM domain-containing protein [Tenacibaculum sp.]|nr:DNA translocase FtsK 4TM domain-containing protein [Tenacibaculum sp.]